MWSLFSASHCWVPFQPRIWRTSIIMKHATWCREHKEEKPVQIWLPQYGLTHVMHLLRRSWLPNCLLYGGYQLPFLCDFAGKEVKLPRYNKVIGSIPSFVHIYPSVTLDWTAALLVQIVEYNLQAEMIGTLVLNYISGMKRSCKCQCRYAEVIVEAVVHTQ